MNFFRFDKIKCSSFKTNWFFQINQFFSLLFLVWILFNSCFNYSGVQSFIQGYGWSRGLIENNKNWKSKDRNTKNLLPWLWKFDRHNLTLSFFIESKLMNLVEELTLNVSFRVSPTKRQILGHRRWKIKHSWIFVYKTVPWLININNICSLSS